MHEFMVPTQSRTEMVDITAEVNRAIRAAGVTEGLCHVFVPHTTAGITINENADPDVARDILTTLDRLVPRAGDYRHSEGNSDAHVKASLMGSSVTAPIAAGRLSLGTWQAIYLCEFDGPRHRRCLVVTT
ncbi:MAG TPA: secondary thiamine-phosphate synthase enzyme YjbQ [Planctomycetota bacterium]|nr:secondary thiamine-phosphate synthase enzyme YjbQ [Planctomycetota bacterium]HRR80515.1 secondary thiamine-phosphate synthase enzyme YjbQ [Planctomycetota bacterium]HRT95778.1 secondary thiamine-phosphate synthase enzyme YjbQ [Planctomycetota bacterium]